MAATPTKFPADQNKSKSWYQEFLNNLNQLVTLNVCTTSTTVADLKLCLQGEIDNVDPRA